MRIITSPRRVGAFAAAAGLLLAACGDDDDASPDETQPATQPPGTQATGGAPGTTAAMEMPPLPEFASGMTLTLDSPSAGGTLTENEIDVNVDVNEYDLSCDESGKPVREGVGHYHLVLDGVLVDMFCTPQASVSMQNVPPGEHTLAAHPALNDHNEVLDNEVEFEFTYEPTDPLPDVTDKTFDGEPSIEILSPQPGDTVKGEFDVEVEVTNFDLNCDLLGKPGVFGAGHYHINLDTSTGPMMGMGTMLAMTCDTTFTASTEGLEPGSTHTVIALLADNGHAPLPGLEDGVEVTIG
jgi:hypothetical protein